MNIGLGTLEMKLLSTGLQSMTLDEKNELVSTIARKEGKSYFEITEEYILAYHKRLKIESMTVVSDETIVKGFTSSNGHIYRTNRDDQINMIGKALQLTIDPTVETVPYKSEDAGYMVMSKEDWISDVFMEGLNHKEKTLHKYNTLKANVEAATTEADLLLISWDGEALL